MKRRNNASAVRAFLMPRDITAIVAVRYLTLRDVMHWLATCRHYRWLLTERSPAFWRRVSMIGALSASSSYGEWRRIHLDVFDRGYAPGREVVRLFLAASHELQTAMLRSISVPTAFFRDAKFEILERTVDMSNATESTAELSDRVKRLFPLNLGTPVLYRSFELGCPAHHEGGDTSFLDIVYVLPKDSFSLHRIVRTCPHDPYRDDSWMPIDRSKGSGVLVAGVVRAWKKRLLEL